MKMKLKPEDLLDVISNIPVMRKWLSNSTALDLFEYSLFNTLDTFTTKEERSAYLNFYKDPNNAFIDPIILAKTVLNYVYTVLSQWKQESNSKTAKKMVASLPLFVEMSKYLPHVNPKGTYDFAFRGTRIPENTIKKFVQSSNIKDWKFTKIHGLPFMTYAGPKKNQITYQPHRDVQSWSVSGRGALGFGNEIIAVPLDDTFFFDPSFTGQFGYNHEKETIHYGKEPMKAALFIPRPDFIEYLDDTDLSIDNWSDYSVDVNYNESINESEEIQDEEGTLTIPGL